MATYSRYRYTPSRYSYAAPKTAPTPITTYTISQPNGNSVLEGQQAVFRITRSGPSSGWGAVNFKTSSAAPCYPVYPSSASPQLGDYWDKNTLVSFAPGVTQIDIAVDTIADKTVEGTEVFYGSITGANGYNKNISIKSGGSLATSIRDNVVTSQYSIARLKDAKEGEDIVFRISRTGATQLAGGVGLRVSTEGLAYGQAATEGTDFTRAPSYITFAAGETFKDVSIKTIQDLTQESSESFRLTLQPTNGDTAAFSPNNLATISDPRWVGTIGNDDSNVIIGTPGNDFIDGKGGKDVLTGGLGSDIFFISEKPISSDQADYITDFNPVSDRLRISRQAFGITSDIGNIPFITSKNLGGLQGTFSEYFIYDTTTGQLTYDQNGSSPGLGMGGTVAVIYTNPGAGSFLTAGSIELA